jgi:RHS repeat-associated protein
MKSFISTLAALVTFAVTSIAADLTLNEQLQQQVRSRGVMGRELLPLGEPNERETLALLIAITDTNRTDYLNGFEDYARTRQDSAWTPAVRVALAEWYRQNGRYTPALAHWESVWEQTRQATNGPAKLLADRTLGEWASLLASLGRYETLTKLFAETATRHFDNGDAGSRFQMAREGYAVMRDYPGTAFRCGTFALRHFAKAINHTNSSIAALVDKASPRGGFKMSELVQFAHEGGLELVPVKWQSGTELPVPSVVHWKQDHYAAIIAMQDNFLRVVDPTFGGARWIDKSVVEAETSGALLVTPEQVQPSWRRLTVAETAAIHGKGQPANIKDWDDCGGKPSGKSGVDGNNYSGENCGVCNMGMPTWWVTEPYTTLWVADEPLRYQPSVGEPFSFRWTYRSRWASPYSTSDVPVPDVVRTKLSASTNFAYVSHNWNSHISFWQPGFATPQTLNYNTWEAVLVRPDGTLQDFASGSTSNDRLRITITPLAGPTHAPTVYAVGSVDLCATASTNGFKVTYPDGSVDVYGLAYIRSTTTGKAVAFLTQRISKEGHKYTLCYENVARSGGGVNVTRIKQIVDPDGRTNTFTYSAFEQDALTEVTDAYGRKATMTWSIAPKLSSVTDPVGIYSTFGFEGTTPVTETFGTITGNSARMSQMTTPYGTTFFEHYEAPSTQGGYPLDQGNIGGHDRISRGVAVLEPGNRKQLYVYRFDTVIDTNAPAIPNSYASGKVPEGMWSPDNGTATSTSTFASLRYRNSFYWGPRQFANASTTNAFALTVADYKKGRMRHWLAAEPEDGLVSLQSDYLSIERDPSPDAAGATEGQLTWYDYSGKDADAYHRMGTTPEFRVGQIARVLPDGTTQRETMTYGTGPLPTERYTTFTDTNGSVNERYESFTYSSAPFNLLTQVAPDESNPQAGVVVGRYIYNTNNQVLGITNALSEVTSFQYNTSTKQLTNVQSSAGVTIRLSYYTAGVTGLATNDAAYHNAGYLASIEEVQTGRKLDFTWTNGLVRTMTDERGLVFTNSWDGLNRLTGRTFADGYSSNVFNNLDLSATRDQLGNWSYFGYDANRRMVAETNELGRVTRYGWCSCGALETITNALNQVTTFYHDNQARLTTVLLADTNVITYQYDLLGRTTNVVDGANRSFTYGYNNQGLLTSISNAYGRASSTVFDSWDRPIQFTDALGVSTTNTFDRLYRTLKQTAADGSSAGYLWSTNGLQAYTNQLGAVTWFTNDVAGRRTAVLNANNEVTRYLYDSASNLTNLVDGKSQTNRWQYDVFGRVTNKVDATGTTVFRFQYDANDRLTNRWTPAKGNTAYSYNALGSITNINYASSTDIAYQYDALERLTNMVDAVGTSAFTYTATGQLLTENGPWADDTITYGYTQLQRTSLSLTQPSAGAWVQLYAYDDARRLASVSSSAGTFGYTFAPYVNGATRPAANVYNRLSLGNGTYITNSFDNLGRLSGTTLRTIAGTLLNHHGYEHDVWIQRTNHLRQVRGIGGILATNSQRYTYDAIGQLKTARGFEADGSTERLNEKISYGYDAAGNLLNRTNNAFERTFTVNTKNELTGASRNGTFTLAGATLPSATNVTVSGSTATRYQDGTFVKSGLTLANGNNSYTVIAEEVYGRKTTNSVTYNLPATVSFTYDGNGSLTDDGKRAFTYDDENQLTEVQVSSAFKSVFTYDGLNRRRQRQDYSWTGSWSLTNTVRYLYDGMTVIQERDGSNVPLVSYTRGTDIGGGVGGLLARTTNPASSGRKHYYYQADGNGNITALTDEAQRVVASYTYDSYGNLLSQWGTEANANKYRFSSKEFDTLSGIYYYGFRYYEPNLQRWLNQDPIGEAGGINLHCFVGNGPVSWIDTDGLAPTQRSSGGGRGPGSGGGRGLGSGVRTLEEYEREATRQRNMSRGERGRMIEEELENEQRMGVEAREEKRLRRIEQEVKEYGRPLQPGEAFIQNPGSPNRLAPVRQTGTDVPSQPSRQSIVCGGRQQPRGGVYALRDPATRQIMRTGRSNDLERREGEHARDPELEGLKFEPLYRSDLRAVQRGIEQFVHEQYNPPLNRINPISPSNPNRPGYMNAAQQYLNSQQGK